MQASTWEAPPEVTIIRLSSYPQAVVFVCLRATGEPVSYRGPPANSLGMSIVTLRINGVERSDDVEPRMLLVQYLREVAGLTGTHVGCETSICGACTILVDGRAVKSCTQFAVQVNGRSVTTIEGLAADGELDPLQEAFWNEHGLQCGFCTPGMILTAHQLLETHADPDETTIRHAIDGNLCRCTGYHNIVRAIQTAAAQR